MEGKVLLSALVQGFRVCASGMTRGVEAKLLNFLGPDWKEKARLPRQHVWREVDGGETEVIDLEGILLLLVRRFQLKTLHERPLCNRLAPHAM